MGTWKGLAVAAIVLAGAAAAVAQPRGAAEVRLNRGIESFMAEKYDAARAQFQAALEYDADFAAAYYFLGLTDLQLAAQTKEPEQRQALLQSALEAFESSRARDPSLVTAYLDGAIAETILGRFEEAQSSLSQFLEQNPDEPLPYLFLAILYYREAQKDPSKLDAAEENLQKAEAALARQEKPQPSIQAYIKFYQALVYLQRNQRQQAQQALQDTVTTAPDTGAAVQGRKLLEELESGAITRRPWDLSLRFGFDYDTNVILRGHDIPLEDFDTGRQSAFRFGLGTLFNYRFLDNEELVLGVGTSTFNSWNCGISEFNVQTYGGSVFGGYSPKNMRWLTLGLRYDYDYSLVGNDPFLSRHRLTPQVTVDEASWTRSTVFYQYDHRDYQVPLDDPRLNRDGDVNAVGLVQDFELFRLFERPVLANLSYRYENYSTVGSEFATENNIFALGFAVPLPKDVTFDFRSEWEHDNYKNRSIFSDRRATRRDMINTLIFGLTKAFNENVALRFEVDWTMDDSNIRDRYGREPFTYDRIIYGLTLICNF